MMNTDKVNAIYEKYAGKSDTKDEKVTTEAKVETKADEVKEVSPETGKVEADTTKAEQPTNPDAVKEETNTKPVDVEAKTEKKPTIHSKQEQIDYAFQKKQAKIKKLEQRNRELEEELKKMKGLKLEDFKGEVDKYVDYKVDFTNKQNELNRNKEEASRVQREEAERINQEKIVRCFPDEAEQQKYNQIIAQEGANLVAKLDDADPDQAVLGYLDDSEISPLLVRVLIAEPNYLNEVLSKRSPYGKYQAMAKLEEKIRWAQGEMKKRNSPQEETHPVKPAIPVVGSVTKSEAHKDTKPVFDPNAILHDLKNKNKYHK